LRSPDREMRYLATRALEQIMAEAPAKTRAEIVEALQKVATDNDDMVRTVAQRTLAKLGQPVSAE
jgi:HEAT repeat protein